MKAWLNVHGLRLRTVRGRKLGRELSFQVSQGESLIVEGANGAGKTTLLRALVGLHRHFEGAIELKFEPESIAYLPQLGNVQFYLPMTLRDVVGLSAAEDDASILALELLNRAELDVAWNSASGGERQKALVSRALLSPAELFILDEPLNHLDIRARRQVQRLVAARSGAGSAFVIVSHEAEWPSLNNLQRIEL